MTETTNTAVTFTMVTFTIPPGALVSPPTFCCDPEEDIYTLDDGEPV